MTCAAHNRGSFPCLYCSFWALQSSVGGYVYLRSEHTNCDTGLTCWGCQLKTAIDRLTLLSAINAAHADIACWGLKRTVHTCMQYNDSPFLAIWACVCDSVHHLVHISSTLCNNSVPLTLTATFAFTYDSDILQQDLKNIKNVEGCGDGMPKSMQTW